MCFREKNHSAALEVISNKYVSMEWIFEVLILWIVEDNIIRGEDSSNEHREIRKTVERTNEVLQFGQRAMFVILLASSTLSPHSDMKSELNQLNSLH